LYVVVMIMNEKVEIRYCKRCGDKIPYRKDDYPKRYRSKKFCSKECAGKYNAPKKGEHLTTVTCSQCGKEIEIADSKVKDNNFCSRKCHNEYKKTARYIECDNCGKEFREYLSKIKKHDYHFCSMKCRNEGYAGKRVYTWKGGVRSHWRGENWQEIREKALERDDYICQDCGLTNQESLEKYDTTLQVHHIIPYSETQNNSLDNLVSLCVSCHMRRERRLKRETNRS